MSTAEAIKRFPACAIGAMDGEETISNLRFAAQHELDMHEEDQDGCCTAKEAQQIRRYLKWIDGKQ